MQTHDQPQEPILEVLPPSALESMTRAETDMRINTAHRYPRSMAAFKKRALDMALIDQETAESCIYCRPVGMKDGKQQYAEGFSVRLAEIVAASYCNLEVGSMVIEQTPRMVKCRGMAHDLETNFKSGSECVETTVTKKGDPFSENMRNVVAKACLAKAWRDALFKVVPRALCKPIETEIRKLMLGDTKSLESRRAAVMSWVNKLSIDVARVFAALDIVGEEDIGSDQLMLLTGLKTALKEGDTTIEDAFPPLGTNPDGAPKFVPKKPVPLAEPKAPTEQPNEPAAEKPQVEPVKTGDHAKRGYSATNAPQEPAAPANVMPSTETAPLTEKPPQTPASPTDWRQAIIPGKNPKLSGKPLGDFSHEMQEVKAYADGIDLKRATAEQKRFIAQVAMAMAELFPKSAGEELPLAADDPVFDHTKMLRDLIKFHGWDEAFFITVCKLNTWIDESVRKIEDISAEEFSGLDEGWKHVEEEMAKTTKPAQQP